MELMQSAITTHIYAIYIFFLGIMLFNLYSVVTKKILYLWQKIKIYDTNISFE